MPAPGCSTRPLGLCCTGDMSSAEAQPKLTHLPGSVGLVIVKQDLYSTSTSAQLRYRPSCSWRRTSSTYFNFPWIVMPVSIKSLTSADSRSRSYISLQVNNRRPQMQCVDYDREQ